MAPPDPVWSRIHQALVSQLKIINSSQTPSGWFYTVKKVFDYLPENWDRSTIPCLAVFPAPVATPRTYLGGSRSVEATTTFEVYGCIRDDQADSVSQGLKMYRLIADVHRAVYASPNLGMPQVRRVMFPVSPALSLVLLADKTNGIEIRYSAVVIHGEQDDNP